MRNIYWICFLLLTAWGCESLEDTYSDMAGDGAIRYVGSCVDVEITPGWQCLNVKWLNNPDPTVNEIRVKWKLENVQDSLSLAPGSTECQIPHLGDGNYEVRVYGVNKKGGCSLTTPLFARPYTMSHEAALSFTRVVSRCYFVGEKRDRLVLLFSPWSNDVESATLIYHTAAGKQTLKLTSDKVAKGYLLLPDPVVVDQNRKVQLARTGMLEGCENLITFDTLDFSYGKFYSSGMKQVLKEKYGKFEIDDDFADNLQELEIDYSISTLEDIFNFPGLKTLRLGKNRFLDSRYLDAYDQSSELFEKEISLFALEVAHEICGLEVERYNQHFLPDKWFDGELPDYIRPMGNPSLPEDITYLDSKAWSVKVTPEDDFPWNSNPSNLLDGNWESVWYPQIQSDGLRTHEIVIDMQETKQLQGIVIAQNAFNPENDGNADYLLMPSMIKVKISTDQAAWKDATYVEENVLGNTAGEKTVLHCAPGTEGRYLKFIVNDQVYGRNFSVKLAEIKVF